MTHRYPCLIAEGKFDNRCSCLLMTHDELLAICDNYSFKDSAEPVKALRAVVELHKPREEVTGINDRGDVLSSHIICNFCTVLGAFSIKYPCPTIVAIEKELG